jgi:hypothetical protein
MSFRPPDAEPTDLMVASDLAGDDCGALPNLERSSGRTADGEPSTDVEEEELELETPSALGIAVDAVLFPRSVTST